MYLRALVTGNGRGSKLAVPGKHCFLHLLAIFETRAEEIWKGLEESHVHFHRGTMVFTSDTSWSFHVPDAWALMAFWRHVRLWMSCGGCHLEGLRVAVLTHGYSGLPPASGSCGTQALRRELNDAYDAFAVCLGSMRFLNLCCPVPSLLNLYLH